MLAHASATGPTTDEGKRRCKFNALKHGLRADTATYYPAKPGGYPHCNGCEYRTDMECLDFGGCLKRTELLLRHQIAFESGDPSKLQAFRARTQAHIQALIDDMILAIAQDGGPRIKSPEWYYDKDGIFHLARFRDAETDEWIQLEKIEAHPLLKLLMDYISKNKMTLEDMGMTPKAQDEQESIRGYLDHEKGSQQEALEYQRQTQQQLEHLQTLIGNSYTPAREPVTVDADAEVVRE